MNLNCSEVKIAVLSDVHLGHARNPTSDIIANLRAEFPDTAETGDLDLIVIAGDLFDDLMSLPDEDVVWIDVWIAYMLQLCAKYGIVLRILEGTPSHDWKQSNRFNTIEQMIQSGADMRYVKDLSIEYFEQWELNALYVPDEWDQTDATLAQVKDLLRAKGLSQVDLAFMHGQFSYQLPPVVKAPKHDEAEYLALVRYLIFIGHVHIPSSYDRIHAQGSFDCLSHGEEHPKGHIRAKLFPNGEYEVQFVENVGAKKFVTAHCMGMTLEQTLDEVDRRMGNLPPGSFARIEADPDNPILNGMETVIRRYPLLIWSKVAREQKAEDAPLVEIETTFQAITLTPENLGTLLMERVSSHSPAAEVLECCKDLLQEVL